VSVAVVGAATIEDTRESGSDRPRNRRGPALIPESMMYARPRRRRSSCRCSCSTTTASSGRCGRGPTGTALADFAQRSRNRVEGDELIQLDAHHVRLGPDLIDEIGSDRVRRRQETPSDTHRRHRLRDRSVGQHRHPGRCLSRTPRCSGWPSMLASMRDCSSGSNDSIQRKARGDHRCANDQQGTQLVHRSACGLLAASAIL
jgi:hypothetical protein